MTMSLPYSDQVVYAMGEGQRGLAPNPAWWRQYLDYTNQQFESIGFGLPE